MSTRHVERSEAVRPTTLDRVFGVGVLVKGIDGAIELVVGLALLLFPGGVDAVLDAVTDRAQAGSSAVDALIATVVGHADAQVASGGAAFLIAFLIAHGVIKLALVYALLKRIRRAYPWAIGILGAFLAYQLVALALSPSVLQVIFSALDLGIIVLVWREHRSLGN